jgi:hypothetical protein
MPGGIGSVTGRRTDLIVDDPHARGAVRSRTQQYDPHRRPAPLFHERYKKGVDRDAGIILFAGAFENVAFYYELLVPAAFF